MRMLSYLSFAVVAAVMLVLPLAGCGDDRGTGQQAPGTSTINPQTEQDIRMYEDALSKDPNNLSILIQLGNKYYDLGVEEIRQKGDAAEPVAKWEKAIGYYKRALAIEPGNADVRTDMANLIQWLGRVDEAMVEYRMAKQSNPNHPQSRINILTLLAEAKQDYKGAVKEYDDMVKAMPGQGTNFELAQQVEKYRQLAKEQPK